MLDDAAGAIYFGHSVAEEGAASSCRKGRAVALPTIPQRSTAQQKRTFDVP